MEYLIHILVMAGLYVILTVSLNLVLGYAGLPAMGQSAFFCIGAYTSSLICIHYGISPWITLCLAAGLAGGAGWLISHTASRLAGDFLALATFGFAVVTHSLTANWSDVTRGPLGLSDISPFMFFEQRLDTAWAFFPLVAVCCFATVVVARRLVDSPFGRIIQGMRESATISISLGIDVGRYTRTVFTVGAFFAGIAGTLYAHYIMYIDPTSFTPMESVTILLMVVFGGMGSIAGSISGATTLVLLPEALRFIGLPSSMAAPVRQMLYGGILVALMIVRPSGLLGRYKWR
jgi:branched-chain amino acid transport system permease protein